MEQLKTATRTLHLTANNRVCRYLNDKRSRLRSHSHNDNIKALKPFIITEWEQLRAIGVEGTEKTILSDTEERYFWGQTLKSAELDLINSRNIDKHLTSAREIVQLWQIPLEQFPRPLTLEHQFFVNSYAKFQRLLDQYGVITIEQAVLLIAKHYQGVNYKPWSTCILYGFNDIPPLYETLITAISDEYSKSAHQDAFKTGDIQFHGHSVSLNRFNDDNEELTYIASKVNDLSVKEPQKRIGVIFPNLASIADKVDGAFFKQFHADQFLSLGRIDFEKKYDISIGQPLSAVALIGGIIQFFEICRKQALDRSSLIRFGQSPYFFTTGGSLHTLMAHWLNRQTSPTIKIRVYLSKLESIKNDILLNQDDLPDQSTVDSLIKTRESLRKSSKKTFSQWNRFLMASLFDSNWMNLRAISSYEYQAVLRFSSAIEELVALEKFSLSISFDNYFGHLKTHLQQSIFQTQTKKSNVSIMGMMEGIGIDFDYCFLAGVTENAYPQPIAPNPLIPLVIQQDYKTPKSSHLKELEYAVDTLNHYFLHSHHICISYSKLNDGRETKLSPLLSNKFQEGNESTNAMEPSLIDRLIRDGLNYSRFTPLSDEYGARMPKNVKLPGGSYHFKLNAINPLYAYIVYRLKASPIEESFIGLDFKERGNLLHDVLAQVWDTIKNQQALLQYKTEGTLQPLINNALDLVFLKARLNVPEALIHIEKKRLNTLVTQILTLDEDRHDFTIFSVESEIVVNFEQLELSLRLDRIDILPDGSYLIIDYKSSNMNISSIAKSPLLEPQLPLYTLLIDKHVSAVAFIEATGKKTQYLGLSESDSEISGISKADEIPHCESWESLSDFWSQTLKEQANHIKKGYIPDESANKTLANYYSYLDLVTQAYR